MAFLYLSRGHPVCLVFLQ